MEFFEECAKHIAAIPNNREYRWFKNAFTEYDRIIILGNGGSNAIASHMSQDYVKAGGKHSLAFSDPAMLTCFVNDYGLQQAYVEFLKAYVTKDTLVILISSRGESSNILNCVWHCEDRDIPYGVLTAFNRENRIRYATSNAIFDYHIDTHSYGVAECVHQTFLHGVVPS